MRILIAIALACVAVGHATPAAHAQKSDADKKTAAKKYVDAGLSAEGVGDYETAVEMYQKAYALIPHPVLLFNIANAYYLAKDDANALSFYQQYLDKEPKGAQSKAAKGRIAELEKKVDEAKRAREAEEAARAKEAADKQAKIDADRKAKEDADRKAKEDADRKAREDADRKAEEARLAQARRDAQPKTFTPMRIAGLAAGTLGAVALGGGVFFGLKAKGISDELSEPGAQYDPAKVADGESANKMMFISYGVGAALVATGAVLWVIGKDDRVAPIADEDTVGLAYTGTF